MNLFTPQFFLGFTVGIIMLGIYFLTVKPLAGKWAKKRIKILEDANNHLHIKLQSILKGDEKIFQFWQKAKAEIKFLQQRVRFIESQNNDLGDTIVALSNEKSALQDLQQKHFIECDILKTQIAKLTSPIYSKKVVTKQGKIKDEANR